MDGERCAEAAFMKINNSRSSDKLEHNKQ
jgi:hypothetical protein